jgi:predicted PurR-regulated permease PerM
MNKWVARGILLVLVIALVLTCIFFLYSIRNESVKETSAILMIFVLLSIIVLGVTSILVFIFIIMGIIYLIARAIGDEERDDID